MCQSLVWTIFMVGGFEESAALDRTGQGSWRGSLQDLERWVSRDFLNSAIFGVQTPQRILFSRVPPAVCHDR